MNLTLRQRFGMRFVATFATLFALLQFAVTRNESLRELIVVRGTIAVAAQVLTALYPGDHVHAVGRSVVSEQVRMNVLNGCEGLEAIFLLLAAIVAFPARWQSRLKAMVIGCAGAYCLNQLRIVLLYATLRDARSLFELMHGYVAPTFVVMLLVLYFGAWSSRQVSAASNRGQKLHRSATVMRYLFPHAQSDGSTAEELAPHDDRGVARTAAAPDKKHATAATCKEPPTSECSH